MLPRIKGHMASREEIFLFFKRALEEYLDSNVDPRECLGFLHTVCLDGLDELSL